MKRTYTLCIALLLSLTTLLASCKGDTPAVSSAPSDTSSVSSDSSSPDESLTASIDTSSADSSSDSSSKGSNSKPPSSSSGSSYKDPEPTAPPKYSGPAWDTYSDTWVGTDALGRTMPQYAQVGATRKDKTVGMVYSFHHPAMFTGEFGDARNLTDMIKENAGILTNNDSPQWCSYMYFWGKPLFGYYDMNNDDYVIKRHVQMLSDIGVDTLVFLYDVEDQGENTMKTALHVLDVMEEVKKAGGKVPKFFFVTIWFDERSQKGIDKVYKEIYSKGKYKDLWFYWDGKPLIIGDQDAVTNSAQKRFFTYRANKTEYTPVETPNTWPWLSNYPQKAAYTATNPAEMITVSPAQNWVNGPSFAFFSAIDKSGNFVARGRSWSTKKQYLFKNPVSSSYPTGQGINFQQQLDHALKIDPDFLYVTQWNEWTAGRFTENIFNTGDYFPAAAGFVDQFTAEFSRDLEPTRTAGMGDNYYMQLAQNIRKFKGVSKPAKADGKKTIKVDGNFSDWDSIKQEFRDDIADQAYRDVRSLYPYEFYINKTGRNDFKRMKVARDNNNLYFYVETQGNISDYRGGNWMRLFIKTTGGKASWENYNYVINRTGVTSNTTTLEKSTGGWKWKTVNSKISYRVKGNKMELAIPLKDLGLKADSVNIEFKWHDNMQTQGDVYEFHLNGDAAPNNRFNYLYTVK